MESKKRSRRENAWLKRKRARMGKEERRGEETDGKAREYAVVMRRGEVSGREGNERE